MSDETTTGAPNADERMMPEAAAMAIINDLIRYKDLLEEIVQRITDWHSIDREALIALIGEETERWSADDMPPDTWLAEGVAEYQATIEAKWAAR